MVSLITSPAMGDSGTLVLAGYGVWRSSNNQHGRVTLYKDVLWRECRRLCLNSSNCTGVEYSLRANDGDSYCEVHSDKLHKVKEVMSGNAIMVWKKQR